MGDYSYLDDLPPSGGEDEFGTAAYYDVGTEDDQLPTTSDIEGLIGQSGSGGAIQAVHFVTSSQSLVMKNDTTRCFCIIIGAGGGGNSDNVWPLNAAGGGAGGVTIGLVSVNGGASVGVSIGSGGAGGNNGSNGADGSASSFGALTSYGGHGASDDLTSDGIVTNALGGKGSTDFDAGVLWSKRGGRGYTGAWDTVGAGGNPWAEDRTPMKWGDFAGRSTEILLPGVYGNDPFPTPQWYPEYGYYFGQYALWNVVSKGLTAHYGCGGYGALNQGQAGDGGNGIVIVVELS